jgi:hypothetical protein
MPEFWIHISPLGTFIATMPWFLLGLPTIDWSTPAGGRKVRVIWAGVSDG